MPNVILVIEDDPDQRRLMERTLASKYRVVTAVDGQAGVDTARDITPNLIVLDVMMPRLNGYQACRALKEDPVTASIPILILTTKDEPADEFWAAQVGANAFLQKPVDITALLATVKRLLDPA